MTKGGLQVNLPLYRTLYRQQPGFVMVLDCALEGNIDKILVVVLRELRLNIYQRVGLFMTS